MKKTIKLITALVILALLAAVFAVGFSACESESLKNDVEITFTDMNGTAIADTQITIGGITDMDIAEIRTTDSEGKITLQNLEARELSFTIVTVENSYNTKYALTEAEVEQGYIQVQFTNYAIV